MSLDFKSAYSLIRIVKNILEGSSGDSGIEISDWRELIIEAKKHGLSQFLYRYMKKLGEEKLPPREYVAYLEKQSALEIRVRILQEYALDILRRGFEERGIDRIFIKGTVTRNRYPDQYLRTMGDIDFVYNPEQHAEVCKAMAELGFETKSVGRVHDIYELNGTLLEAHRQFVSSSSPYYAFSKTIGERAEKSSAYEHEYEMTTEDELLFNFTHLASHFKKGGVGIRFILDVWIYKNLDVDIEKVKERLSEINLWEFYKTVCLLADKWFGNADVDSELVSEIEAYILSGSTFGNDESKKNASLKNGKVKYFFRICFPSFEEMKSMYPGLKSRVLLPFAWIRRGFGAIFKRRNNVKTLLAPIKNGDEVSAKEFKKFLNRCALE